MIVLPQQYPPRAVAVAGLVVLVLLALLAVVWNDRRTSQSRVSVTVDQDNAFPVTARPSGDLRPGVVQPLNLALANHWDREVLVTGITVTVAEVRAPRATPERPCSLADYRATAGNVVPLRLPAGGTLTLQGSGAERRTWPTVAMLDTNLNQDGCKGAEIVLTYETALELA